MRALARAHALTPTAELHLAGCESCREIAGQYRWLAAELRALGATTPPADESLVAAICDGIDRQSRRLRRARAAMTVAGGVVVASAATVAGLATMLARRERVLAGA